MLIQVWLALFAAGVLTSIAAFGVKTASLYAALLNIIIWAIVGVAAFDLEVVSNGEVVALTAPAVGIIAVVQAVASLPVVYLAAVGRWDDFGESDGTDSAVGEMDAQTLRRR